MKQQNQILAVAAVVLFLLSAWTYRDSVHRAERFERGQDFLPNPNPDEIARIEIKKGGEETVLRRSPEGDRFVIPSADGYRAQNSAVNRLIKDVLELSLEKRVGEGEALDEELELVTGEERPESTIEVALINDAGSDMVRFLVGKAFEGGGNYVRRVDGNDRTVYLTNKRVFLQTEGEDFVDKLILDVPRDQVASVRGQDFAFEKGEEEGATLSLVDLPEGKRESSQASQVKTVLQGLRFIAHHLADAAEAQGLVFDRQIEVQLDDGSGYVLESAARGDRHYLRIGAFHTAGRISIAQDASEEEVRETSEVLERADELQGFNAFHGSWVYEVTVNTADRVRATKSDLLDDA